MFDGTGTSVALKESIKITVEHQASKAYVDVDLSVPFRREHRQIYHHNEDLVGHRDPTVVEDQQISGGEWFCACNAIFCKLLEPNPLVTERPKRKDQGTYYRYQRHGTV